MTGNGPPSTGRNTSARSTSPSETGTATSQSICIGGKGLRASGGHRLQLAIIAAPRVDTVGGVGPTAGFFVAVLVLGLNLRTVFASLPPLLTHVRGDLGLSAGVAGLLTTGPLLCFGGLAPVAPSLVRRAPVERVLVVTGVLTAAGAAVRGGGGGAGLFAGTLLAGAAVALTQA